MLRGHGLSLGCLETMPQEVKKVHGGGQGQAGMYVNLNSLMVACTVTKTKS